MVQVKNRGQSTLEYVLLVTAVIVIMIGLLMSPNSPFRKTLNTSLGTGISHFGNMSNRLFNSH